MIDMNKTGLAAFGISSKTQELVKKAEEDLAHEKTC